MKKSYLEYIVIAILFGMVMYQYLVNKKINNEIEARTQSHLSTIYRFCDAINYRCIVESLSIDTTITLKDTLLNTYTLYDIIKEDHTLILYTTDNDCSNCLSHAIEELAISYKKNLNKMILQH